MAKTTSKTVVLQTRMEEDLLTAIRQLREGNSIASDSEMSRLLIRRGIMSVVNDDSSAPATKPVPARLSPDAYIQRGRAFEDGAEQNVQNATNWHPQTALAIAQDMADRFAHIAAEIRRRYPSSDA